MKLGGGIICTLTLFLLIAKTVRETLTKYSPSILRLVVFSENQIKVKVKAEQLKNHPFFLKQSALKLCFVIHDAEILESFMESRNIEIESSDTANVFVTFPAIFPIDLFMNCP